MAGSPALDVAVIVVLFAAGCWAGSVAEAHYGRTDPGYVVLDEVVGMLLTLLFVPVTWVGVIVGFLLFRVFDIVKPFPARQCERLHGGFGIMADDAWRGSTGNLALRLVIWASRSCGTRDDTTTNWTGTWTGRRVARADQPDSETTESGAASFWRPLRGSSSQFVARCDNEP